MDRIILIETSTALCSTALSEDGRLVCYRESETPRAHASLTAVFIDEMLREKGLSLKDCAAVCVSEGPGSYTGLRVGVSSAKGLCFGAGIPLLSVGTLEVLVAQALSKGQLNGPQSEGGAASDTKDTKTAAAACAEGFKYIVPMIDARRMEVYTALFSAKGERLSETEAKIIDSESYKDILEKGPVLFIGDGAGKCEGTINHPNARFLQTCPKASAMCTLAQKELNEKRFKDVAYLEPFYLKDFVATTSKKNLF